MILKMPKYSTYVTENAQIQQKVWEICYICSGKNTNLIVKRIKIVLTVNKMPKYSTKVAKYCTYETENAQI